MSTSDQANPDGTAGDPGSDFRLELPRWPPDWPEIGNSVQQCLRDGQWGCYHGEYTESLAIAAAPDAFQPLLTQLRQQLAKVLPDAEELIAYNMPGFGFGNSIIAGYAAFSKQCGLYVSKGSIAAHAEDIANAGLKATKTGVTFTAKKPIPDKLVKKLALASRKELGV